MSVELLRDVDVLTQLEAIARTLDLDRHPGRRTGGAEAQEVPVAAEVAAGPVALDPGRELSVSGSPAERDLVTIAMDRERDADEPASWLDVHAVILAVDLD